jgi:hypothetical protein
MRSTLKLLHLIGMAGFLGSIGACLTLGAYSAKGDTNAVAFMRAGIAYSVRHVTLPSLWIILATGLVLTALQRQFAVWIYAKIGIGVVILFVALFVFAPAVIEAAQRSQIDSAASTTGLVLLALGLSAAVLGIFRPRGKRAAS